MVEEPSGHVFYRFVSLVTKVQMTIAVIAVVLMVLVIVVDVLLRAVLNMPLSGSYDAVGMLLLVSVFFAFGPIILARHEIVIDLVDGLLPPAVTELLSRFSSLLGAVVLGYLFWAMFQPMFEARAYGDISLELGLPLWIVWCVAMIGMAGGVLAAAVNVFLPSEHGGETTAPLNEADK